MTRRPLSQSVARDRDSRHLGLPFVSAAPYPASRPSWLLDQVTVAMRTAGSLVGPSIIFSIRFFPYWFHRHCPISRAVLDFVISAKSVKLPFEQVLSYGLATRVPGETLSRGLQLALTGPQMHLRNQCMPLNKILEMSMDKGKEAVRAQVRQQMDCYSGPHPHPYSQVECH